MTVLAGVCAALAMSLLFPGRRRWPAESLAAPVSAVEDRGLLHRLRWVWSALAGVGALAFVQGPLGPVAGVAAGVGVWTVISRSEAPGVRKRREATRRELPHLVELYAAALASGGSPGESLGLVCAAMPGPTAEELRAVHARLRLGVPAVEVWTDLAHDPALGPLGRTLARAQTTGAPVVDAVRRLADELSERARADVEDRARTVGVKAAVPLGLCLLPAFLLLGIVPLVAGAVSAITW